MSNTLRIQSSEIESNRALRQKCYTKQALRKNVFYEACTKHPLGPKPAFGGRRSHTLERASRHSIMLLAKSQTISQLCTYLNGFPIRRHWYIKLRRWFSWLFGTSSLLEVDF